MERTDGEMVVARERSGAWRLAAISRTEGRIFASPEIVGDCTLAAILNKDGSTVTGSAARTSGALITTGTENTDGKNLISVSGSCRDAMIDRTEGDIVVPKLNCGLCKAA
jgi:hypothetical protein